MNRTSPAVPFLAAALLLTAVAHGQCDLSAIPGDPLRELRGNVDALAVWDPDGAGPLPLQLVAGGSFDIGTVHQEHVVLWDGAAWTNTHAGFGNVTTMLVWNGLLVAAADDAIWTFDGSTWSQLASVEEGNPMAPLPGSVHSMIVWNGELVIGGKFTRVVAPFVPAVNANLVARCSTVSGWSAFGAGPTTAGMTSATVQALAVFNNTIWVGLDFNASFASTPTLQYWNAGTWLGQSGWTDPVDALATRIGTSITNSWLFAARHSPVSTAYYVAGFNPVLGTSLPFLPPPTAQASKVEQFFVRSTGINTYEVACALTTTGNDKVWRWSAANGWTGLPSMLDSAGSITAARVHYFGGRYVAGLRSAAGAPHGLRWHDSALARWTSFTGPGFDGGVLAVCHDGQEVVIGGDFTTIAGTQVQRIARGGAGTWQPMGPGFSGLVRAVVKLANGDLVAAGNFTTLGDGTPMSRIARWNGSAWSPLGSGTNGTVYALLPLPNGELIAGGQFTQAGGQVANGIARWTGSTWLPLGSGCNAWVYALSLLDNGDIVAGGNFSIAGGQSASRVAVWNGSSWAAMGSGFSSSVWALARIDGRLCAAGEFQNSGIVAMPHIAVWNGSSWAPLDPTASPSQPIVALASLPGGGIAIGGAEFTVAGSGPTCSAVWRGAWQSSDVRGVAVQALAMAPDGRLALGGLFDRVGGTISVNAATLSSSCAATAASAAPGCASSGGSNSLAAVTLPWTGSTLRTRATGLPTNALVVVVTSVTQLVPALPLAAVLPQGLPGCYLHVAPDILSLALAIGGAADADLLLPATPSIVGAAFHQQMVPMEFDPGTGAWVAITATNALRLVAGAF